MNSECRVLIVSRDEMLLRTRELILGAHFQVTAVERFPEAVARLGSSHFDLVVICHSVSDDEGEKIAKFAHESAHPARTLALRPLTDLGAERAWADEEIGVDAGPNALLLKAAEMLDYRITNRAETPAGGHLSTAVQDTVLAQRSSASACGGGTHKENF